MFERRIRKTGFAISDEASACTASMLTRGTVLLLVTARSVKSAASLPFVSSITAPVPGFS